jgi:hypothetical protein
LRALLDDEVDAFVDVLDWVAHSRNRGRRSIGRDVQELPKPRTPRSGSCNARFLAQRWARSSTVRRRQERDKMMPAVSAP